MSTLQINKGKGVNANPIEQTVENTVSTGFIEVNGQGNILQKHWQAPTVEGVIATYFDANSAAETVNELTKMLRAWLTDTDKETGELRNNLRTIDGANTLSSAFRLINLVSELGERNPGLLEDK